MTASEIGQWSASARYSKIELEFMIYLTGTDLTDANLHGAAVTPDQLAQAASLAGATLPASGNMLS